VVDSVVEALRAAAPTLTYLCDLKAAPTKVCITDVRLDFGFQLSGVSIDRNSMFSSSRSEKFTR